MPKNAYFKLIGLAATVNDASSWARKLDPITMYLLETIALRHEQNKALIVGEVLQMSSIASPSSIHKKLTALYELKLIDFVLHPNDRRIKYLHPTSKAQKYFSTLGEALQAALDA